MSLKSSSSHPIFSSIIRFVDVLLLSELIFLLFIFLVGGLHSYAHKEPLYKNLSDGFKFFFALILIRMAINRSWEPLDVPVVRFSIRFFTSFAQWTNRRLLWMLFFYAVLLFTAASLRHRMLGNGVDFSLHLNYLQNAKEGRGFITYIESTTDHLLHNHLYLVEYFIWPLFCLFPKPDLLFFLQTFALVSGGVAVFWLARLNLEKRWQQILCVVIYLIYPRLRSVNLYDFHPDVFSVPLLLFAIVFFQKDRLGPCGILLMMACLVKETVCLSVGFFGIYILFQKGFRRKNWTLVGSLAVLVGFGSFWLYRGVYLKTLPQGDTQIYYYGWLGTNLKDVLTYPLRHPRKFLTTCLSPARLRYISGIFTPLGFLPLLASSYLFMTIPTWGYLMAREPFLFTIYEHHPADLIPFLFAAFIFGYKRLLMWTRADKGGWLSAKSHLVTLGVVAFSLCNYGTPETAILHTYLYKRAMYAPFIKFVHQLPHESSVASNWGYYLPTVADHSYVFQWADINQVERPVNTILINTDLPESARQVKEIIRQGYQLAFRQGPHCVYTIASPTPIEQVLQQLHWPRRPTPTGVLP